MSDLNAFADAARNLSDLEKRGALREYLDYGCREEEAGIVRQMLAGIKALSDKQQDIYVKYIEPGLVERCGAGGCQTLIPLGTIHCANCELKFGNPNGRH